MLTTENNKKRIVFFIGQIGLGGTEKQMAFLLRNIQNENCDYHIVVFNSSPFGDLKAELMRSKVCLHFIPEKEDTILKRFRILFKILRKIKPHIIHSWTIHDNAYAGILGKILNISSIGSVRGSLNGTGFNKLPTIYQWASLKLVKSIIVNSESIRNELIKYGISKDQIILIRNAVKKYNISTKIKVPDHPLICTIGNLRKNKNHELFIRVIKNVSEKYPNVKGIIIGQPVKDEPCQEEYLKSLVHSLGLENIINFMGFQFNPIKFLEQSRVFVLPSFSEGYPNTILEAMSVGVPVIASEVGGIPEIIKSGINGFMFKPNDLDGFSKAVLKILQNKSKRQAIVKRGLKTVNDYHNPMRMIKDFKKIYEQR